MTAFRAQWSAYIDRQHRYPQGFVGRVVGERMLRQHAPETDWTIGLLDLQPTDRILEIGFGVGRGLGLALAHAPQGCVTGVDRSATMIRAAAQRNRAAVARGQLTLLRGDIAALPFEAAHFDKLFSIHTFYFWIDPRAVCRSLISMLACGGRLVSTCATARKHPNGEWQYWEVHHLAEAIVEEFNQDPQIEARLLRGPDSRQYNNVAIVIDKAIF
jgi:SAM-dependent methyltransferase